MDSVALTHKFKVLAVDDVPANLIALEAVLSGDCELTFAGSGPEAIAILEKKHDFGVILMDLQMPKMDGFETAERIKQIEGCHDIPIIFITAIYKEEPFVRRGYEIGAVDYFSKPFDPEVLKRKVAIYATYRQKSEVLKERERQVRVSEELLTAGRKLSSLLESLPVGVLISDVAGQICQTNDEVLRICKSVDPLEHDAYGEILGWWDSSGKVIKENVALSRALRQGENTYNEILHIKCLDGSPKTVLASVSPLLGLDGKIVGAVIVIQDVTETQKFERDFEQKITKLLTLGVELEQSTKTHGAG